MSGRWTRYFSGVNPSCRDAMGLFSRSLDRPSSRFERAILAIHMLHCPACRRSRRQVLLLVHSLRRLSERLEGDANEAIPGLPVEVRERIKRALRRK